MNNADSGDLTGYADKLYYPHQSTTDGGNCYGYWLASPSASYNNYLMSVHYGGNLSSGSANTVVYGVRPVVSLPSELIGANSSAGKTIYYLAENEH